MNLRFYVARSFCCFAFASLSLFAAATVSAQSPAAPAAESKASAHNAANFDAAAATQAWLDTMPASEKERSDAYFEGTYWLLLWNTLLSAAICLLFLKTGWSARIRDFAERTTKVKTLQVVLYAIPYMLITAALSFPLGYYEGFMREHQYGMANQTIGAWLGDQGKGLIVDLIFTTILLTVLYAVFRRAPRLWWAFGAMVTIVLLVFVMILAPVFVSPLFNKYTPLADAKIRDPILALARANEIPVTDVYEFDASRQTKRVSANVSGFLNTTRISLNDNLLNQCTLPEIRHVMAHEMGHYVLNHSMKILTNLIVLTLIAFVLLRLLFAASLKRWGANWGVRDIADPAGFPLLTLIFILLSFLATPLNNTLIRTMEREADAFGINAAREPDGMAKASLKLGKYRKMSPGPLEEIIFFDHPSGRARIRMAMDWKAAHPPDGTYDPTVGKPADAN